MKKVLIIYLLLTSSITAVLANHVIDDSEVPQFLFVVSATAGSYDGETLTLTGVPSVIYFSDRPYRIAGHVSLEEFVELWREGVDDFAVEPPNATLSIYTPEGNSDAVIELIDLSGFTVDSVSYRVVQLQGEIPEIIPVCSLFIDTSTKFKQRKTPGVY